MVDSAHSKDTSSNMNALAGQKRSRASEETDPCNNYAGYTLPKQGALSKLDVVDPSIAPAAFFASYVAKRRPCIISGLPAVKEKTLSITSDILVTVAGDCTVEVEKRPDINERFGQNRSSERQVNQTVKEFVRGFQGPDRELYYLSTQQGAGEEQPFAVPCQQLLNSGHILASVPLAGNLLLQSCNLWMGAATRSASGLHHDYHDNFYLLVAGRKQFRLYAPCDATFMDLHGSIQRIHPNGVISYEGSPSRADGSPLDRDDSDQNEGSEDDDDEEEEEEEVVLGKGFDYQSDDEDGNGNVDAFGLEEVDDYEDLVATEEEQKDNGETTKESAGRPDHFSPIDPMDEKTKARYPSFLKCRECIVELEAGQCLYLPAGWFHFVTSSCESKEPHVALNYWYHPPDQLVRFENPYQGGYWKKRAS